MLNRIFGSKTKRPQDDSLAAVAYRARKRITNVQIPLFERRAAELRKRIAEKRTDSDGRA